MSNRRNKPPNRWGCKPSEDVCVEHDLPLECRHGCRFAYFHECKDAADRLVKELKAQLPQGSEDKP